MFILKSDLPFLSRSWQKWFVCKQEGELSVSRKLSPCQHPKLFSSFLNIMPTVGWGVTWKWFNIHCCFLLCYFLLRLLQSHVAVDLTKIQRMSRSVLCPKLLFGRKRPEIQLLQPSCINCISNLSRKNFGEVGILVKGGRWWYWRVL